MKSAFLSAASLACVVLGGISPAHARGPSPYLPMNLSPEMERQIERVMVIAGKPVMKRPFAAADVLDALAAACRVDEVLCKSVRRYLDAYMNRYALTHASAELAATQSSTRALPNRHGMLTEDAWSVSAQGLFQFSDYILLQAGGLAYPGEASATGSWLSFGWDYAQLDVGWRDHWWSPMTDSAMLISTQAPTMPSVTLSNYTPISPLRLRYELYAAEMSHSDAIVNQGQIVSGSPQLGGMHLSVEPAPGYALAFARLLQYGGDDRPSSFTDFMDAFFNPVKYDNDQQFGNQVAAFSSRIVFPTRRPFSVYFEYAGEDGSRAESWRLGNVALSAGLDIPQLWDRFDFTYEITDWQNGWYVNNVYLDGLSSDGHVIGQWGADERVPRDAVGATSQSVRIGWAPRFGGLLELRYRMLKNENYSPIQYDTEHELALRYSRTWRNLVYGGEVEGGRDVFGEDFGRVAAFVRYVPGEPSFDRGFVSDAAAPPTGDLEMVQIFVDAGVNASRVHYNPSDKDATPETDTDTTGPHLGLGARRRVSRAVDLGARVEFDTVDGRSMIGVRAIDYRYRFGQKFAITAFAGATRYYAGTAAYGYYGGLGAQWRDALPRMDLNLDLRATDKVARDVLLADDPASVWGDVYFQIYSANLYLSYRFR